MFQIKGFNKPATRFIVDDKQHMKGMFCYVQQSLADYYSNCCDHNRVQLVAIFGIKKADAALLQYLYH